MKLMGTWDEPAVCALTLLATACHRHRERRLPLISEHQAARVPGARVEEIGGAGHSPYFEQPDAWNSLVGTFLRECP